MFAKAIRAMAAFAGMLSVTACSVFGGAAAPEPGYSVVLSESPFEVRDYDELTVVETSMTGGSRAAFGRLFEYISGANNGERDIAMTAPVLTNGGSRMAMTAPVLQTREGASGMAFILPDTLTTGTAPVPTDPGVTLGSIAPRRVAVVRYSGFMDAKAADEEARLREWIDLKGWQTDGSAEVAGYNPPWTLPPWRRNEVLIPVARD